MWYAYYNETGALFVPKRKGFIVADEALVLARSELRCYVPAL